MASLLIGLKTPFDNINNMKELWTSFSNSTPAPPVDIGLLNFFAFIDFDKKLPPVRTLLFYYTLLNKFIWELVNLY